MAAVTRRGALEVLHTKAGGGGRSRFRAVDRRTWSSTSSPALTLANDGRLWLTTVSARGGLFSRHTEAGGLLWHAARESAGLWSPYSSPATTVDVSGRLWLAAVRTDGSVSVRSAAVGSTRWQTQAAGPGSAVTASPAFLVSNNGGVRLGSVSGNGGTVWERTRAPSAVDAVGSGPRPGAFSATLALILHL